MKALVLSRYGGPEASALRDVAIPTPKQGEVLVRVKAAGLNPVDFKTREGKLKLILPYNLPAVMTHHRPNRTLTMASGKPITTAIPPINSHRPTR